jgi:hypothetical protein
LHRPYPLVLAVGTLVPKCEAFGLRSTSALSGGGIVKHPLAYVLEQLIHDVHDMFSAAALRGEVDFGFAGGYVGNVDLSQMASAGRPGSSPQHDKWYAASAQELDVRPLVEILNEGSQELQKAAEGAMHCLSVNTKVAVIRSGGLSALVNVLGAGAARAIVHVLCTAPSMPDGSFVAELMAALCRLGSADGRVAAMALDTTPALLELLRSGTAGREQAAGALWNLRMLNATVWSRTPCVYFVLHSPEKLFPPIHQNNA